MRQEPPSAHGALAEAAPPAANRVTCGVRTRHQSDGLPAAPYLTAHGSNDVGLVDAEAIFDLARLEPSKRRR